MFEQLSSVNPNSNPNSNSTPSSSNPSVENTSFARVPDPIGPAKKKSKALIISLIVAFLILAGGGGALAYYYQTHIEEIITNKIIARLDKVSSFKYNGTIETTINYKMPNFGGVEGYLGLTGPSASPVNQAELKSAKKNETSNFQINFQGLQDSSNQKNNSQLTININSSGSSSQPFLSNFNLGLEARWLDKTIYAKLTNLPDLGFFDTSFLKDQWVSFDATGVLDKNKLFKENMTPELRAQLLKLLIEKKVLVIKAKLPSEKLDNQNMFHYQLTVSKEGLDSFDLVAYPLVTGKQPTPEEIAEMAADSTKLVNSLEDIQIWIGKDDYLPHKLSFNSKITETSKSEFSGSVSFVLTASDFNQPVVISAPESSKSFAELMDYFLNSLDDNLPDYVVTNASSTPGFSESSLNKIDSDSDGLNNNDELIIYGTNPYVADTDLDGYNDYQELVGGFNPSGTGRLTDPDIIAAANLLKLKATSPISTSTPSTSITPSPIIPAN